MKLRLTVLLLATLALTSCDKLRKVKATAENAANAVKEKLTETTQPAKPADPALQKLVDQTADGVIFRKDLPFPLRLEVRTTYRNEMVGRSTVNSEIEKQVGNLNGTQLLVYKTELWGDYFKITFEKSSFTEHVAPGSKNKPQERLEPQPPPATFRRAGKKWRADQRTDFRTAALAQQLGPTFDELLVEHAVAPRHQWFGKHRFKVGDELSLDGDALALLVGLSAKGTCKIKLESFEAVEGHPCGVFAVTGQYSRKHVPSFQGNFRDEDVAIRSGKVWCSLLYPVILKQELETIESGTDSGGGRVSRTQGSAKVSVTRAWKALEP